MKHPIFKLSFLMLIAAAIATVNISPVSALEKPCSNANYEIIKRELKSYIAAEIEKNHVTGLSLALVDDQKTVWTENFGVANRETGTGVTSDTLFYTASNSKLFTATAIMQLVEAGKIDLDKPLKTYLPDFEMKTRFPKAGPITIRSILTHHSGLPDSQIQGYFSYDPDYIFPSVLPQLKNEYVSYPPNFMFAYSNLGFELLGEVIARVTGQDYAYYMKTKVLMPLGMNHSHFKLEENMKPLLAQGYVKGKPFINPRERAMAEGGLISNVVEMSNFLKMVFAGGVSRGQTILQKATLDQMLRPQTHTPLDFDSWVGLAWLLDEMPGAGKTASHGGDITAYHSGLETLPDSKLGVVVLTNSDSGSAIAKEVAREVLRRAFEAKTGRHVPPLKPLTRKPQDEQMTARLMRSYEGYYAMNSRIGGLWSIQPDGASWCLEFSGFDSDGKKVEGKSPLHYHEGGWFSSPNINGCYFRFAQIGGVSVVISQSIKNGAQFIVGEKLEIKPLPQFWQQRLGTYQVMNDPFLNGETIEVSSENNLILADEYIITPVADELAIIRGLGRGSWEAVQFKEVDGLEVMYWSGLQFNKVNTPSKQLKPSLLKRL